MQNYEFSLRFDVSASDLTQDLIDDRLYAAGCDDALVRHGRNNEVLIEFNRASDSAINALLQAKQQVLVAIPSAILLEAKPDYVGPTDIAKYYNVSRQRIQAILSSTKLDVHPLTSVGNTQIFRLAKVIDAFEQIGTSCEGNTVREAAYAALQLNRQTLG